MAFTNEDIKQIQKWLATGSINIFGMPFSGKDTQANRLAELFDAPVIAGGDILRAHPDQEKIKELSLTGELFPTDFYLSIILPYLSRPEFAEHPLLLSSVGRWKGEETPVIEACQTAGHPIKAAVFLSLEPAELWRRWEASQDKMDRGPRYDDNKHTLEVRLDEYRAKTWPVIDVYRQQGILVEVDGIGTPEVITERIIDGLLKLAQ